MGETIEVPQKRGITQKLLDGVERLGNRVPHPTVIFITLCGVVIVLSQILYMFDIGVTYEVAVRPPVPVEIDYDLGGSEVPHETLPPEANYEPDHGYEIVTEHTDIRSLLTADGIRFIFTSFVSNFANFSVVAVIFVAMIGVGV